MKIPLRIETSTQSHKAVRLRIMANEIVATRRGDWNARRELLREFRPLLQAMADKRSSDPAAAAKLVSAGEAGVLKAVRKFNPKNGAEHFQVFSLPFIEKAMNKPGDSGFLARLFGRA
jgi:DNA-directed RNA polymerase specialized sigma subunit